MRRDNLGRFRKRDLEISNLKYKCEAAVACCVPQHHSATCSLFISNPRTASMTHTVTFDPLNDTGAAGSGGWVIPAISMTSHIPTHT